jgi:transposase-like protein
MEKILIEDVGQDVGLGETEGARRATGVSPKPAAEAGSVNPEVSDRPTYRRFGAEYKLKILEQADACKNPGEIGALLRREGLYTSHLFMWRQRRKEGGLSGLADNKRGRKARPVDAQVKKLLKEKAHLEQRLKRAELIIDVQKKVSEMLGIPLKNPRDKDNG